MHIYEAEGRRSLRTLQFRSRFGAAMSTLMSGARIRDDRDAERGFPRRAELEDPPDLDTRVRILRKAARREEQYGNLRRAAVLRRMALDLVLPAASRPAHRHPESLPGRGLQRMVR